MCCLFAACGGSSEAPPPRTPKAVKTERRAPLAEAPAPAPPEPSAYEKQWLAACEAQGALGQCPAPFDRPALYVDTHGKGPYTPPASCSAAKVSQDGALQAAIEAKRGALRACFRNADKGAWAEYALVPPKPAAEPPKDSPAPPKRPPEKPSPTTQCVAKVLERALAGKTPAPGVERVVVLKGGPARERADAFSKESIHQVVEAHAGEVNSCYDGALEVWPGLKGRMTPAAVIWFDGTVALVHTTESTLKNAALECCINTAMRSWRFGAPANGEIAIVTFPFVLGGKPQ